MDAGGGDRALGRRGLHRGDARRRRRWVVRSHRIEYLRPAFAGDRVAVVTWVADFRRAFSMRKYEFVRPVDNLVLARGETDWVYVDAGTGRPRSIPASVRALFEIPGPNGGS